MPMARNVLGLSFRINISTSCTVDAMTRMYEIILRYGALTASRSRLIEYAQIEATSMTKPTAPPIRTAVSSFAAARIFS